MRFGSRMVSAAGVAVMAGCGDDLTPATVECDTASVAVGSIDCLAPRIFAARDSAELIPSDEAVDEYYYRWTSAVAAEQVLEGRIPQRYASRSAMVSFRTTRPTLVEPLTRGELVTGDQEFDSLLAAIGVGSVRHTFIEPDGPYLFSITYTVMFSEALLSDALARLGCEMAEPETYPTDDGRWTWVPPSDASQVELEDSTATIDFKFGWGDCFVQCDGFRDLRATVSPDGLAVVQDMGGDELPEYLQLSPTTLPPP